jgi:hypothetical protein
MGKPIYKCKICKKNFKQRRKGVVNSTCSKKCALIYEHKRHKMKHEPNQRQKCYPEYALWWCAFCNKCWKERKKEIENKLKKDYPGAYEMATKKRAKKSINKRGMFLLPTLKGLGIRNIDILWNK